MEFVGRRVRKDFPGRGTLFGSVQECLPVTGLFKIIYDYGGGSEELNLWELLPLLISSGPPPPPPQHPPEVSVAKVKRKAKKPPRRIEDGSISGGFVDKSGNLAELGLNTDEGVDRNGDGDHGRNSGKLHGFDLNQAAHVGLDIINEGSFEGSSGVKRKMIDLNLDVDNEIEDVKISEKKVKWFDLNVEFKEDDEDDNLDDHAVDIEKKEEIQMENCLIGVEDEKEVSVETMEREDRKREEVVDYKIETTNKMNIETGNLNSRLESTKGEIPDKRISDSIDFDAGVSESGSSRSSLKEKMDSFSGLDYGFNASGMNNQLSAPTISVVTDEKIIVSGHETFEEALVLPPKVDLPPSSGGLDLDGVSVFDLVSVYAFLRSFSTLLFLSPFELDDFVTCVKCDDSTSLFDSIHVSILRTLRLHLVFLSKEGSQSATTCLRSLNWDFLDLITWPVFLVDYLLFHSPGYIPGLDLSHFEVFQTDYYKTSASGKISILRHLCDDVIEIESFKSEINRRTLTTEHIVMDIATTTASITDQDADEPTDLNGDECFLCKNDGNLICCDGCPAAFHSRCVGVVSSLLPEGDWFCPECAFDKNKPWTRIGKSIRGAELLGNDLHGRQFYSSCGYLLVLESCNDECPSWSYKRNDLPAVVKALVSSPYLYHEIITAICKHWNLTHGIVGSRNDLDSRSYSIQSDFPEKWFLPIGHPAPSEALTKAEDSTEKRPGSEGSEEASSSIDSRGIKSEVPRETHYINFYEFARTASSVLEELTYKSSDKSSEGTTRSVEDIGPGEMKVISNKFAEFSWSNMQNIKLNSRKEKCGWCLYCKVPEDGRDCIFIVNDSTPAVENFTSEVLGIKSAKNRKNHLIDVICHVTCIEDRLQGLLLGPWLNPHYSQLWRESVLEAVEVGSLKNLLLQLESNLHHLALSVDWRKHVDSVATTGSASHIVRSSARVSLKLATGGKRGKCPKMEITPTSKAKAGLRLFWWRGGRASREIFNCKVLPRSLTSKAARQGGCKKILGIHYSDGGEYAKRMRYVAWRAAVETSRSVPQLALQVRELNANIRWTDIENCSLLTKMEKKSKKPIKSFKNVVIRKKQCEGQVVKYLLDFGKKRFIPDIVVKHGSLPQDSSSERKKYWINEMHVPLHLLKAYEARRIARKSNKIISGELCEISAAMKKPFNKKGFPYLFSKAEKSETRQCGHCSRDIHIRKAVSCQYCKGFFHKKHARESAGSSLAVSVYTCYKCEDDDELVQTGAMEGKSELTLKEALMALCSGKEKKLVNSKKKGVPLVVKVRNSAKTAKSASTKLPLQNKKGKKEKKGKEAKPEKGKLKKLSSDKWKKKRTPVRSSYWLNGLQLTRRENDERLVHFKSKMLLVPSGEETLIRDKPKCSLCCEIKYSPKLNYVACEICGVWFHADALNLGIDKMKNIIGFKCHNCLNKKPPVCPHHGRNNAELVPEKNAETELVTEDSKDILLTFNFEKQKSSGKRLKRKKLAFYERILMESDSVEVGGNS